MANWAVWVEPNGKTWRCRWRGKYGAGQQPFIYRADAKDYARDKKAAFQRADAGLEPLAPPAAPVLVKDFAETFLANSKAKKAEKTYSNFDKPGVGAFVSVFGPRPITSLTPLEIEDWSLSLEGPERNATTAAMIVRVVKTFLNYAVKMDVLAKSPARHVGVPFSDEGGRALTDEEYKKFFPLSTEPLYRTGVFSSNTGLRIGEVEAFDWSWVEDTKDGPFGRVPAPMRKTRRKVRKDCFFPLRPAALAVMGKRQKSGRVFNYNRSLIQHHMIDTRDEAGIPDITFHDFRHTFATNYLASPEGRIQDLLNTRLWTTYESLLRYVHDRSEILVQRFCSMRLPHISPKNGWGVTGKT